MTALTAISAVLLDLWLGEPRRWHSLVGFGRLAGRLEARLNAAAASDAYRRAGGALAWCLLVLPPVALVALAGPAWWLDIVALYWALGANSLARHAAAVSRALATATLAEARRAVGLIVSRDTGQLDAGGVRKAAVETVLENGSDAVLAPLFWFVLGGAPGVVAYRLANTLDALWGYRNERYRCFGSFSARLDDVLNWVPARLVALTYALLGNTGAGMRCWRRQASQCDSPNAGPVMCAGAGALGVELGGPASYRGIVKHKPVMGGGRAPVTADIARATGLVRRSLLLWCAAIGTVQLALTGAQILWTS